MKIALLSDTHDDVASTLAALALLQQQGPAVYLHAGDLVDPEMLQHFAGLPLHFVFGNNEYDHAGIRSRAHALGLHCHGNLARLEFEGKKIALTHGHQHGVLQQAIRDGWADYVVHGHTHVRRDERLGNTRIINPGAVHRARPRSAAILDLASDNLQFIEIPHPA